MWLIRILGRRPVLQPARPTTPKHPHTSHLLLLQNLINLRRLYLPGETNSQAADAAADADAADAAAADAVKPPQVFSRQAILAEIREVFISGSNYLPSSLGLGIRSDRFQKSEQWLLLPQLTSFCGVLV